MSVVDIDESGSVDVASGGEGVHRDGHDAGFGNGQPVRAVLIVVVANFHALGYVNVFVDDGSFDSSMPADLDSTEKDRIFDFRPTVDLHLAAKDGMFDAAAGDD